jgi:hypothetical protein
MHMYYTVFAAFAHCFQLCRIPESTEKTECQAFSQVVRIGSPRHLNSRRVLPSPLLVPRGEDTLACRRGNGRTQFGRGDRHFGTLGIDNPSTVLHIVSSGRIFNQNNMRCIFCTVFQLKSSNSKLYLLPLIIPMLLIS